MFQATVTRTNILRRLRTVSLKLGCRAALLSHFDETNTPTAPALSSCQQDLSRCDIRILEGIRAISRGTTVIGHWAWPVSLT